MVTQEVGHLSLRTWRRANVLQISTQNKPTNSPMGNASTVAPKGSQIDKSTSLPVLASRKKQIEPSGRKRKVATGGELSDAKQVRPMPRLDQDNLDPTQTIARQSPSEADAECRQQQQQPPQVSGVRKLDDVTSRQHSDANQARAQHSSRAQAPNSSAALRDRTAKLTAAELGASGSRTPYQLCEPQSRATHDKHGKVRAWLEAQHWSLAVAEENGVHVAASSAPSVRLNSNLSGRSYDATDASNRRDQSRASLASYALVDELNSQAPGDLSENRAEQVSAKNRNSNNTADDNDINVNIDDVDDSCDTFDPTEDHRHHAGTDNDKHDDDTRSNSKLEVDWQILEEAASEEFAEADACKQSPAHREAELLRNDVDTEVSCFLLFFFRFSLLLATSLDAATVTVASARVRVSCVCVCVCVCVAVP